MNQMMKDEDIPLVVKIFCIPGLLILEALRGIIGGILEILLEGFLGIW